MHADHITGTGYLKQLLPGTISAISKSSGAKADKFLENESELKFGGFTLKGVSTPGHTNGCMTYMLHDQVNSFYNQRNLMLEESQLSS